MGSEVANCCSTFRSANNSEQILVNTVIPLTSGTGQTHDQGDKATESLFTALGKLKVTPFHDTQGRAKI